MALPLDPCLAGLEPGERPRFLPDSTACWRGYVATWRIADGELLLLGLTGRVQVGEPRSEETVRDASLGLCFPWLDPPIPATWFTGWLRCPEGRLRHGVHAGFASVWERDRWILVEAGIVAREEVIANPPWMRLARVRRPLPRRRRTPSRLLRGL